MKTVRNGIGRWWIHVFMARLLSCTLAGAALQFSLIADAAPQITVTTTNKLEWIGNRMFGVNFSIEQNLFNNQFKSAMSDCGIKYIRYPGGVCTERESNGFPAFDYLTNAPYLSDILTYTKNNSSTELILTIPVFRFTAYSKGAWKKTSADGSYYYIDNVTTLENARLHADANSGTNVTLGSTSWTGDNVQWQIVDAGSGYSYLVHKATGEKLHYDGYGNDEPDLVSGSYMGDMVKWRFIPCYTDSCYYYLQNKGAGKILTSAGDSETACTTFITNDTTAAVAYATNFVNYVNTTLKNQIGMPKVTQWELGNEYYQWNPDTSDDDDFAAASYAIIATAQAVALHSMDTSFHVIAHYMMNDINQCQIIGDYIRDNAGGSIDEVATHIYTWDAPNIEMESNVVSQLLNCNDAIGFSETGYVTEWNSHPFNSTNYKKGMKLGARQMICFEAMALAGVEYADLWPLMWQNDRVPMALADADGTLRPQGQAYQWLQQSADRTWLVDSINDSSTEDFSSLAFMDSTNRLSVLIMGGELPLYTWVNVEINGFTFDSALVQRMYSSSSDLQSNDPALIESWAPTVNGNTLSFYVNKFRQYEIIKIDLYP
ncbi:MAG: hypothetical protein AB7E95_05235 [Kiritimatiellales bacterium]